MSIISPRNAANEDRTPGEYDELAQGDDMQFVADLDEDGRFNERIVTISANALVVSDPSGTQLRRFPLADIANASVSSYVGSGSLNVALVDHRSLEVVRFTPGLTGTFSNLVKILERYRENGALTYAGAGPLGRELCKKCGLPLPDDNKVCIACVDRRATLLRLLGYGSAYKGRAVWMVVLSFVGQAMSLVAPVLTTKVLIDQVLIPHRHSNWIGLIVLGSIGLSLASAWVGILRGRIAAWLSTHMVYAMRLEVYSKLQELSISYFDKHQAGSLTARVTQDVNELRNFLTDGVQYFCVNSLTIIGILIIMLLFNWKLTLLSLIPIPLTVYLTRRTWKMLWKKMHRFWHLRASLSGLVNNVLGGMRVVKAFAKEDYERDRFGKRSRTLFDAEVNVEQSLTTVFPLLALVATAGTYVINLMGGYEVFGNTTNNAHLGMTLGTLQLFLVYLGMMMAPVQGMTRIADWMSRSTAAAERVFEVIDSTVEVDNRIDAVMIPRIEGRVELRNVRFSYDKNINVLDDVSLDVSPGEMIGLVGHSGAGKSTIINLLSRFYDVSEGAIYIDGIDIKKIDLNDLRRQVGVVLQEPFLFPGTVQDNISYAKPNASIVEVMRAARAANAHDFIMRMSDGYDTWVGERGARLSGGERQRISIARAILHNPRILILDEATASVDTETEKQIQDAITRLIRGRTTFAIAHRLSTLRDADRLVVMEKGKVAEIGTHDELMSKPEGVYHRLVEMQQAVNKLRDESSMVAE